MKRAAGENPGEDLGGHPAHPAGRQAAEPRAPEITAADRQAAPEEAPLEATGVSGFPVGIDFDGAFEFSIERCCKMLRNYARFER